MEYFNNYKIKSVPSADVLLARVLYPHLSNTSVFFSIKASNTHFVLKNRVDLKIRVFNNEVIVKEYILLRKEIPANSTVELLDQKLVLKAGERLYAVSSAGSSVPVDIFACAVERYPAPSSNPFTSPITLPDPDLPPFTPDPDFPDLPLPVPRIPPDPWEPTPDNPNIFFNVSGEGTVNSTNIKDSSPYHWEIIHQQPGSNESMIYDSKDPLDNSGGTTTLKSRGKYILPNIPMVPVDYDLFSPYTLEFKFATQDFARTSTTTSVIAEIGQFTTTSSTVLPLIQLMSNISAADGTFSLYLYYYDHISGFPKSVFLGRDVPNNSEYSPFSVAMTIDVANTRFIFDMNGPTTSGVTPFLVVSMPTISAATDIKFTFGGSRSTIFPGAKSIHFWDIIASLGYKYTYTSSIDVTLESRLFNTKKY